VRDKQLLKIKASYKINPEWIKKEKAKLKQKENERKTKLRKRKKEMERLKKLEFAKREKEQIEKFGEAMKKMQKEIDERKKKEKDNAMSKEVLEKKKSTKEESERKKAEAELKKQEAERKKEEAARIKLEQKLEQERKKKIAMEIARKRAERIRKRKFPMDDLKLIEEDKELNVKPPEGLKKPPNYIPYALVSVIPHSQRPTTKTGTPASVINLCTTTSTATITNTINTSANIPSSHTASNYGTMTPSPNGSISSGNRGLISDLLQIYHFFVGDMGYARCFPNTTVPFELKHLFYAVHEIVNGNMKKNKTMPPLINHLFMVLLKVLTIRSNSSSNGGNSESRESEDNGGNSSNTSSLDAECNERSLDADLTKLNNCLSEISLGEIIFCYVDLMERYYSSEASNDPNALQGIPIKWEWDYDDCSSKDDMDIVKEDQGNDTQTTTTAGNSALSVVSESSVEEMSLPDGYGGYVGPPDGALSRAYMKLSRLDPWNLTADELMALLRVMTDDVLGRNPDLSQDIADRCVSSF